MNISLSKRLSLILFAGYFVVLLMMAITLYITIKNTNSVKLHSQSVLNSQIPQMLQLMHMDMQVLQSLNHLNEFLITGVEKDRKRFYTSLSQLNQLSKDVSLVEKLKPEISKHLSDLLRGYSDKAAW